MLLLMTLPLWGCSFDYGESAAADDSQPDIVMHDVEYVRVRDGYPVVRFKAASAERYESRQVMDLENFTFEQFESHKENVNAMGSAGIANVELESGNIHMTGGVRLEVESEDITIETRLLDWQDKDRRLSGGELDQVDIQRSDGTTFFGWGFSADARRRTWTFSGGVEGTYIQEDDEEESSNDEISNDESVDTDDMSGDEIDADGTSEAADAKPSGASPSADKTAANEADGDLKNLLDMIEAAEK
jgi:LPS export ABC transporter protein LptC